MKNRAFFCTVTKQLVCVSLKKKINMNKFWLPVSELLDIFSRKPLQTACGIVFFIKQLVCVLLENKKNQYEQVLALVSELLDLLSRKPLHRLFRLFFCLFLFKLPVLYHSSLNF